MKQKWVYFLDVHQYFITVKMDIIEYLKKMKGKQLQWIKCHWNASQMFDRHMAMKSLIRNKLYYQQNHTSLREMNYSFFHKIRTIFIIQKTNSIFYKIISFRYIISHSLHFFLVAILIIIIIKSIETICRWFSFERHTRHSWFRF